LGQSGHATQIEFPYLEIVLDMVCRGTPFGGSLLLRGPSIMVYYVNFLLLNGMLSDQDETSLLVQPSQADGSKNLEFEQHNP
jgi:hypothetical protein